MPSTYTLNNGIELIGTGEQSGTWGATTNTNLSLLDTALDGQVTVTLASAGSSGSPNDLPISDGAASNGRNRMIIFNDGGDLGATAYVQLTPNDAEKIIYVRNDLSGSRSIILFQGTYNASNDYEVPAGTTAVIFFDGAGSGAVAANVFNNAYFDSLRLGSVSVTAILDEDNMASDSATALATQQSIKAYVDTQVGANNELSEVLANGNTTGGTDIAVSSGDDITFADSSKAIFGAGSDLQIYHDGSDSYIDEVGAGVLKVRSNGTGIDFESTGGETLAQFVTNGAVTLYHNNSDKLATTSTGIDITGNATFADNGKAIFGAGSDLEIYHDGLHSYIKEAGTGDLRILAENFEVRNPNNNKVNIKAVPAAQVELYYDNAAKLATTSTGIDVTGDVSIGDGSSSATRLLMGANDDSKMFHNGVDTYWINDTGNIVIRNQSDDKDILLQTDDGAGGTTTYITVDGSETDVSLHYGGAEKLATTSTGIDVTGTVTADGLTLNDGTNTVDITSSGSDTRLGFVADRASSNLSAFRFQDSSGGVRLNIDDGGDISFYEDTGTTAKFFWDASAESLGIGTTSPSGKLHVESNDASQLSLTRTGVGTYGIGVVAGDALIFQDGSTERLRIDASGNVGIGTSSPSYKLHLYAADNQLATFESTDANANIGFKDSSTTSVAQVGIKTNDLFFAAGGSEAMRIDSSGNLLVGKTSASTGTVGVELRANGKIVGTMDGGNHTLNRNTSDGDILQFSKDNSAVGSIGVNGTVSYWKNFQASSDTGVGIAGAGQFIAVNSSGSGLDNSRDLGAASIRWDDVFATNGTIQTSDQNEKQQIASLTDAEITAAKAISKLFKTFKWNDSVAEKGDAARTHSGVIAQEVEQAMTDAGLNAGDYAFFISTTWWETQTEVPAVEAVDEVLDEDGNVITEAVEAQEAYTRIDTYDTLEEAPEGAIERNRKGIRYPQLLSFIGAATEQRLASIETRLDALEA